MTADLKMKKPILLNGKGRSKLLEVTIGEVKLELWDFEKPEGKPKVRLFVMADERTDVGDQDEETTDSYMDLEAMQTDTLAMAIDRWVQSFESSMPDNSVPSMRLKIGALSLVFIGPDRKRTGHVQLTLMADGNGPVTAKLTRVETSVLGGLLNSLIHEEQPDGAQ